MVRVLLVDDHDVVRAGLRALLESTGRVDVVGEACTVRPGPSVRASAPVVTGWAPRTTLTSGPLTRNLWRQVSQEQRGAIE